MLINCCSKGDDYRALDWETFQVPNVKYVYELCTFNRVHISVPFVSSYDNYGTICPTMFLWFNVQQEIIPLYVTNNE